MTPLLWGALLTVCAVTAPAQTQSSLVIHVTEGENAINSIRMRRGHDPVVQVLDASGEPLAGASVTFLLPASGPSGTFGDAGQSLTVQTDARGMAVGRGLVPNRVEGQFRIRVTASRRGEAGSATITQTNAEPAVKSARNKWIAIAAVVGGAAIGGVVIATHGGNAATTAAAAGGTTGSTGGSAIVPGTPSFGPPR
jgi:hypothetical protein